MPIPLTKRPRIEDPEKTKADWVKDLEELVARVEGFVKKFGWRTRTIQKSMTDSVLGDYKAPALLMQRETVEVILNPVGRFAPGTEGVVDLYLLPAYDDIAGLYLIDGAWTLNFAFRPTGGGGTPRINKAEAMPLDEDSLNRVLEEIVAHVA